MEMDSKKKLKKNGAAAVILAFTALLALLAAGCGGGQAQEAAPVNAEGLKLPPGVVEQGGLAGDAPARVTPEVTAGSSSKESSTAASAPAAAADAVVLELEGGRFTLTKVTRVPDNGDVSSAAMREMKGDYLEFELSIENVSDDYLDLTEFEFRVWSPGIDTDDYAWNYPLGMPQGDNIISAVLLDQDDLSTITYKLKIGEVYDGGFLFFDLNPKSVQRNEAFDPEGATFSVYKARGDGSGEKADVSLSRLVREG
jgi:hypothetical protein